MPKIPTLISRISNPEPAAKLVFLISSTKRFSDSKLTFRFVGLYSPYPTHRGRCHEASCWRSGVRRPRLGLAHTGPGGLGSPSVPTTWGRPFQGWTREGRAGRKPRARVDEESAVRPRKHGPGDTKR